MRYWKRFVHRPDARLPQCHAATVTELADGTLLCAWYAGAYERAKDVAVYGAVLPPGAEEWEGRGVFADTPGFSEGNPILFPDKWGRVWLWYVTLLGERWDTGQVKYAHSLDNGRTWLAPVLLRPDWGWMTGCKPLLLPDDSIVLPLYHEDGAAFTLVSTDRGVTWAESNTLRTPGGIIQPSLAPLGGGRLLMLLRTCEKADRALWRSESRDGGRSWSEPVRTGLPNPDARVDVCRLASGRLALAFNDTPSGRTPLTLALSEDDGETWPHRMDVETAPGEYSYPALVQSGDGLLHLVYTYLRTHVAHVACDEEWLLAHAR